MVQVWGRNIIFEKLLQAKKALEMSMKCKQILDITLAE